MKLSQKFYLQKLFRLMYTKHSLGDFDEKKILKVICISPRLFENERDCYCITLSRHFAAPFISNASMIAVQLLHMLFS